VKEDQRTRWRCQIFFYGLNRNAVDQRTRKVASHVLSSAAEKGILTGKVGKKSRGDNVGKQFSFRDRDQIVAG